MGDDAPPRSIPGWRALRHVSSLPEGPVLAWLPDKDWDDEPWYYVPEDEPAGVPTAPVDDRFLKLDIVRTLTQGNRPFLREQAQAVYTWVTSDTTT